MEDVALILEGVGATHRERGNLPAARSALEEALTVAESTGSGLALGRVHHGFLGIEQAAGNLDAAARHGWRAVSLYGDDENRTRGLAGLAALFQEMGRLEAAEDAWLLVRHLSEEEYYTLYAVDALSHLAALRGDGAAFARLAAESDALGWDSGPLGAKADILLHRGLSYQALGRTGEARRWLERTVAFAEESGFSRVLFEAERNLELLEATAAAPEPRASEAPPAASTEEVEAGLQAMRRELVGAPA
jgi:tetratricopeptide (TPR) repeat protein